MEINDVILGFLDWKPMTGYELKRLFAEYAFIPWSGNNNQIYKALIQLEKEQLVSKTIINQENLPAQKRYSITRAGREQLQFAVIQPPETGGLVMRNNFLLQMAWTNCLNPSEISHLATLYQKQIEAELKSCQDSVQKRTAQIRRNPREAFIWGMIDRNRIVHLQSELNWINLLIKGLTDLSEKRYI